MNTIGDKTRQFCLVSTQLSQFRWVLSRLDHVSNFQVFSNPQCSRMNSCKLETGSRRDKTHRNWVETKENCLVLSAVVFTPPTRGQDKTLLSCPCRRREQAFTVSGGDLSWNLGGGPVPVIYSLLLSSIPLPVLHFFQSTGVTLPFKAALRASLVAERWTHFYGFHRYKNY